MLFDAREWDDLKGDGRRFPLEDDEGVEEVVEDVAVTPVVRRPMFWRSVVVRLGEDVLLSFEARPEDDTVELMEKAAYHTMCMYAFKAGLSYDAACDVVRDWINIEVRGG